MDIARFHRAIDSIIDAYGDAKVQETLEEITSSLSNLGANPGNVDFSNQFKASLQSLKTKLESLETIKEENSVREALNEIDSKNTIGTDLFKKIQEKISENQISPSIAAQEISKIKSEFEKTFINLKAINDGLVELSVGYEFVDPGTGEVIITIPYEHDTKTLLDLANESKDWHQIFSTISEVFDHNRPSVSIKSIGSGSWAFYLTATPLVLLGISITLRRVNQILTELIKTKQLVKQLIEVKAPTDEVEKYIEQKISNEIKAIAEDIVENHYKGTDKGRKNELKTATTITLKTLAKKISSGSRIGLQLEDKDKPTIQNEESTNQEEKDLLKAYENFQKIRADLQKEISCTTSIQGAEELLHLMHKDDSEPSETGST